MQSLHLVPLFPHILLSPPLVHSQKHRRNLTTTPLYSQISLQITVPRPLLPLSHFPFPFPLHSPISFFLPHFLTLTQTATSARKHLTLSLAQSFPFLLPFSSLYLDLTPIIMANALLSKFFMASIPWLSSDVCTHTRIGHPFLPISRSPQQA